MEIKELPPAEWGKLIKIWPDTQESIPNPEFSRVVVAKDREEIVGFWVLQFIITAEPVWIKPKYRKSSLLWKLYKGILAVVKSLKLKQIYTHSERKDTSDYLVRLGFKPTNWKAFTKEVK